MQGACSILVVDDEKTIRRLLQKELAVPHRRILTAGSAREALDLCRSDSFEIILLDIRLPDGDGLELLPSFLDLLPDAKIIMITGHADLDNAITAMRNGAYDFVPKPFTLGKLELVIERAFEHSCLSRENRSLRLSTGPSPRTLVGVSEAIRHTAYLIEKVASSNVPVLITGESGTGKDVVASAVHSSGSRSAMPFVVKNCAGLQKELARNELFGHAKGAYTNALESSEGLMTFAHRGTLFLDEVGELPLEVQAQLLRVLESKRYRRVGDKEERSVDVRFLFATNRNLAKEVQEGRFHDALFHRINVFEITLPPLKERREDIALLVTHFLRQLAPEGSRCSVSPDALNCLMRYHWPGNVRELRNVVERGLILAENGAITSRALPRELVESVSAAPEKPADPPRAVSENAPPPAAGMPRSLLLQDAQRDHILRVLALCDGNKQRTAAALGIARKTLYRKLAELRISGGE